MVGTFRSGRERQFADRSHQWRSALNCRDPQRTAEKERERGICLHVSLESKLKLELREAERRGETDRGGETERDSGGGRQGSL